MPRFYVGQPVVCVDDRPNNWLRGYPGVIWVVRGHRYVIRGNHVASIGRRVMNFVTLVEIHNPRVYWTDGVTREASFWEERFEPATDIRVLEDIRDFAGMQFDRTKRGMPPGVRRVPVRPKKREDA